MKPPTMADRIERVQKHVALAVAAVHGTANMQKLQLLDEEHLTDAVTETLITALDELWWITHNVPESVLATLAPTDDEVTEAERGAR